VNRPGLLAALLLAPCLAGAQAMVTGTLFDSLRSRAPLANATVMINELGRVATTDARGRFRFDILVPDGRYTVTFFHPSLDSLSVAADVFPLAVGGGRADALRLATPSPQTLVRRVCGTAAAPSTGLIVGFARSAEDSSAFPHAEVRTVWGELMIDRGIQRVQRETVTRTDGRGAYVLCGIPADVAVTVKVTVDSALTGAVDAVLGRNLVARVDFGLDRRLLAAPAEPQKACSPTPERSSGARRGRAGAWVVRVRVVDQACAPLEGADVQVVRKVHEEVAAGRTDAAGTRALSFVSDTGAYQLVVRKLGLVRYSRFFRLALADTLAFDVTLARVVPRLATVRVTEAGTRPPPYYVVESDEIANFDRPLDNAWDVIRKMRPEMLNRDQVCPTVQDLFVNGRRQLLDHANLAAARTGEIVSLLKDMRPEHILEVRYIGCFDHALGTKGLPDAVIVVLKPGVEWIRNRGTFVVGADLKR
jgi:hypothetical protein